MPSDRPTTPNRRRFLQVAAPAGIGALMSGCRTGGPVEIASPNPGGQGAAQAGPLMHGVEVLRANGFREMQGKRIGLITNHTSIDRGRTPSRVILQRAGNFQLAKLFAPEHGIDGSHTAGKKVPQERDRTTGLTVYSLYGDTRKPTPAMLSGLDAVAFDLQDIGSRSYTYISTMVLAMEACAERGIEFIVLDRPNPLGGHRVNGPPIESKWISFVGQLPVPYCPRHDFGGGAGADGAPGRLAEGAPWLTLVKMCAGGSAAWRGATPGCRGATSPNIPKSTSPIYYAATGVLGSPTVPTSGSARIALRIRRRQSDRPKRILPGRRWATSPASALARIAAAGSKAGREPRSPSIRTPTDIVGLNLT
ncbi:MAG: DUF1343 domain-containing protein [Verrucomicrobiales bacterium]